MLLCSCQPEMTEKSYSVRNNKITDTNEAIDNRLKEVILSEDLRINLLYVIDLVDSFPNWNFPIIYTVSFFENSVKISAKKTITEIISSDSSYRCVGYSRYDNKIIQIIDDYNFMKNQYFYDINMLTNLSDTVLSSYSYISGLKEDHIVDLNLDCPRLYLKLELSDDSLLKVVEEHLEMW